MRMHCLIRMHGWQRHVSSRIIIFFIEKDTSSSLAIHRMEEGPPHWGNCCLKSIGEVLCFQHFHGIIATFQSPFFNGHLNLKVNFYLLSNGRKYICGSIDTWVLREWGCRMSTIWKWKCCNVRRIPAFPFGSINGLLYSTIRAFSSNAIPHTVQMARIHLTSPCVLRHMPSIACLALCTNVEH